MSFDKQERTQQWQRDHPERMKEIRKKHSVRRISFKGQRLLLTKNPRKNICSECGKRYPDDLKEQTCFHHDEYDENDPLANIRELCRSCHSKLHRRLEKEKGIVHFDHKSGNQHWNWKGDKAKSQSKYRREWEKKRREMT
jgi:hypothetical protein